jgi:excisionase family DNA binding protein
MTTIGRSNYPTEELPTMPPIVVKKSFCTTREAATQLGVSVGTVPLWVESGLLQAWKTAGGHRRVLRDSVESLLHEKPILTAITGSNTTATVEPQYLRILVVEDDPSLLRLYQTHIARWPMATDLTLLDSSIGAMFQMGRGGPDLLITDLHMPGMDGFAMLKVLEKAPEMANTKVVVVTGLDEDDINAGGGVPQGFDVLTKPIPFDRLLSIAQAVSQRMGLSPLTH